MSDPMNRPARGPMVFEDTDDAPEVTPVTAPPVPEGDAPTGTAMQGAVVMAARPVSRRISWIGAAAVSLLGMIVSVAIWDFVTGLLARNVILGWVAVGLVVVVGLGVLRWVAVELGAFARLRRLDDLQHQATTARAADDLKQARDFATGIERLYRDRADVEWDRARLSARMAEVVDTETLLDLVEREVITPLDARAVAEVEAAARQVASVTALVPLALADLAAALIGNIRMIRRIGEVYGGRSGTLGSWRLTRSVFAHLVATGAIAVGDDLIGSVAGGGVLSKLSRRFGEGVVNGALTARVGLAAIEVCRPMPYGTGKKPSVSAVVARALKGLFQTAKG